MENLKGELAHYEQFRLLTQGFQKSFEQRGQNASVSGKGLTNQ